MDIGLATLLTERSIDVAVLAKRAEELGFDSLWAPEHPILPVHSSAPWPGSPDGKIPKAYADMVDQFVALGRASAVTTTLKLGTGICLVPEHNPLVLAKQIATLDMMSGGRFLFGIGTGWHREETGIMGGDFDRRWTQTRESVLAMKELWTKTESEFHGKYYDFPPVYSFPRPAQRPHPPVLLGGQAGNVFKRVAAWGDGWIPIRCTPEDVKQGRATLDELAGVAGRDPASIQITAYAQPPDRDVVRRYEEAGANRVAIQVRNPDEIETPGEPEALAEIERIAEILLR